MEEKWLLPDEYIILEGKVWTWVKVWGGPSGTKVRVYFTNQRLYGKDVLFKIKLFDIPLSTINSIESTKKYLIIEAKIKRKKYKIKLRLKDIDDTWEWMIRERIRACKG